jgi:hypothetical protein
VILQLPACSNVVKYGMLVSKLVAIQSITGANLTLRYMMKHVNDADKSIALHVTTTVLK